MAFAITIIIDQITKQYFSDNRIEPVGIFNFFIVHNYGAMLGMFSKLPAFLRVVTLSTSGFFILSIFAFIQYILPQKIITLRIGLSLLVGGIIGNVIDRTYYGYVIDFLSIKTASFQSPVWNFADVAQWIGYLMLIYSIIKHNQELWPDTESRNSLWVNRKFQLKHAAIYIVTGILISIICFVFSYTYLKVSLHDVGIVDEVKVQNYMDSFFFSFLILILTFIIALFSLTKYFSHRIAGPIYAFERFLNELLQEESFNDSKKLKLRAGDEFTQLENLAERIKNKITDLKSKIEADEI